MSNLKCWKSKIISSNKQIFRKIWWQVKIFRNRTEKKTNKIDKNYIIMIRMKNHLQFRINNTMTCINKKFKKASWIRKVKEKISSRTVIRCIRSINKLTSTNWAKFKRKQLKKNIYWRKQKLIWDNQSYKKWKNLTLRKIKT